MGEEGTDGADETAIGIARCGDANAGRGRAAAAAAAARGMQGHMREKLWLCREQARKKRYVISRAHVSAQLLQLTKAWRRRLRAQTMLVGMRRGAGLLASTRRDCRMLRPALQH